MPHRPRQDVLGDLVALGFNQADRDIRAPQRVAALADQRGVSGGLFGEIACNRDGSAFERPASDERAQQAFTGRQRGQFGEAVGLVLESRRQVGVQHQRAQPRRV